MLASGNHALTLEPSMDMKTEYVKYAGWIRSNYAHVVDALSGERLDIMLQCVKLNVDKMQNASDASKDAFEVVMREVQDDRSKPIVVVGEAASGKSTFARLFLIMCIQEMQGLQFVPFLLTTIDLVRVIRAKQLHGDLIDGYLRAVYSANSRRYLFLKQAMMERRFVLFLDGMDEVPKDLKPRVEAYIMEFLRQSARVVMTTRPGGFSPQWLAQCITMKILPSTQHSSRTWPRSDCPSLRIRGCSVRLLPTRRLRSLPQTRSCYRWCCRTFARLPARARQPAPSSIDGCSTTRQSTR